MATDEHRARTAVRLRAVIESVSIVAVGACVAADRSRCSTQRRSSQNRSPCTRPMIGGSLARKRAAMASGDSEGWLMAIAFDGRVSVGCAPLPISAAASSSAIAYSGPRARREQRDRGLAHRLELGQRPGQQAQRR